MKNTRILVAGTFDFFHKGHQKFIEDAKSLGDELHVIVARDTTVKKIKNFFPTHTQEERKQAIKKKYPEISVYIGDEKDYLTIPLRIKPHIIALGYDQQVPDNFYKTFPHTQIIRLPPFKPEKFKSSYLRK